MPFIMCCLLIVQPSVTFSAYPMLMPLSYLALGLCILSFLVMATISLKHPVFSVWDISVIIYCIYLIFMSFIIGTDLKNAFYSTVVILLLVLLFHYYSHNISLLLQALSFAFSCCVYACALQLIIFPETLFEAESSVYGGFLLGGNYNQIGCRLLCGIISSIMCIRYHIIWLVNTIALSVFSITVLGLVGSMTSLSCVLLFVILSLITSKKIQVLSLLGYFLFYMFFHFFVVFSGEGLHNNETARYIIEDVLGKDITFTNRTWMWESALRVISDSPLFGHGYVTKEWYLDNMDSTAIGPHNYILATLIFGGVTLLLLFIFIGIQSVIQNIKCNDKIGIILLIGTMSLLFMMTFEFYDSIFIFLLFTYSRYYPQILDSYSKNKVVDNVKVESILINDRE